MKTRITPMILIGIIATLFLTCSKDNTTSKDENGNVTSTMQDSDGNTYKTVVIGTQTWMAENLKTTKYSDGTAIKNITDGSWVNYTTPIPAYCWYNNDISNKSTYGALYNWYAVDTKKLCPTGWHVPTIAEWTTLTTFLGGESIAGGKIKEVGTTHWTMPNTDATNSSGFLGLPAGYRDGDSYKFLLLGTYGHWWSSEQSGHSFTYMYLIASYNKGIAHLTSDLITDGFSVRCIKD